ncbi:MULTISPECIES: DUF488 domain-containing protein [unclassified Mesorhizobium]|uniref:DUF488 domain-containing protein n=1 Tax=unclassified Mesorhizobium TaxID=325217 RepID=UPI001092F912|nr:MULTISPECIES: DUF488 domain-containing protein [unclassified Mesorhizobium]TGP91228.1 DUF488 domain-containing protein [Mesorhizobium sp. M8A.F.Ca.ET.218.01.1.1]TGT16958.1 DUF488 domain-containing protein [Mesorhizobium sp. M8A.F.Ca.ET.213.01.1.1]TGT91033.1 DUF488 domain-containing protein [Mesorhizobium sp. M8A.F.Ca.ET.161.01.1.1]TGV43686.1 DUF488 domain-containing protein [Mesorhizobium sp. M8A.F.Ca.ET.142.01.1.1]
MSVVYTIGYEGTDIERFVATLKAVGIERLADVRAVALSRKKGFSKKALSTRLEAEGIEYLHFIDLGDPKPGRDAARAGFFDKFRAIYSAHLDSDDAQSSLRELVVVAGEKPTCLLCFERDPVTCHRSIVAGAMTESAEFEVCDLYGDSPERYVRNAPRMPRYHPREGVAAA